jgi:hypothetical protein
MSSTALNRRDFLLFRTVRARPVAELDCRRLHMRGLEIVVPGSAAAEPGVAGLADGEPAAAFAGRSLEPLFEQLEIDLRQADQLRVVDQAWLGSPAVRARVELLIAAFRARGGSVEHATAG